MTPTTYSATCRHLIVSGKTWGRVKSEYSYRLSGGAIPSTYDEVMKVAEDFESVSKAVIQTQKITETISETRVHLRRMVPNSKQKG